MRKIILNFVMILIFSSFVFAGIPCLDTEGPLLIGQEYCSDQQSSIFNFLSADHYELEYKSVFTQYFNIERNPDDDFNVLVSFGFDLNNPNPTKNAIDYRIVEEYDFVNYVRPSSSSDMINNYYEYRTSDTYSNIDKNENDFIGFPLEILSCYIDCDGRDDQAPQIFDLRGYGDVWYQNLIDTYNINSGGLVPYNWLYERYSLTDGVFIDKYKTLRFENYFYSCDYDTAGEKEINFGCTVKIDDFLRNPNIDSDFRFFGFNDILPETFSDVSDDDLTHTYSKQVIMDLTEDNYSLSTPEVNGGDYITPTGEGMLEQYVSDIDLTQQQEIFLIKQNAELQNEWQQSLLSIIDIVFLIVIIIFYFFSMFVLMFFFFGSFPYIFRKFNEALDKLSDIKIKKRFK